MADAPRPTVAQFYLDGEPAPTPERMVAYRCETRGLTPEQVAVAQVIVMTFFPELSSFMADRIDAQRSEYWTSEQHSRELYLSDSGVGVSRVPIGAPVATTIAEELIASGAKTLLIVGAAGSLQPDLPIGSIVLPMTAIREEGTSHHYLPHDVPAAASAATADALRNACEKAGVVPRAGLHWTTDAPYREHKEKILAFREAGVLSVDMEVSALYALAQHRGVDCAAILAISDEVRESWHIAYSGSAYQKSMAKAGIAALEAASVLAAAGTTR